MASIWFNGLTFARTCGHNDIKVSFSSAPATPLYLKPFIPTSPSVDFNYVM